MTGNDPYIRWMLRNDLEEVIRIERECNGDTALDETQLKELLIKRDHIGMVATSIDGSEIYGYMIYQPQQYGMNLVSLCVDEMYQGQGIGTAFLRKLESKLTIDRRQYITALVSERNETAHAFFKANGWWANLVKQPYIDSDDDGYLFRMTYAGSQARTLFADHGDLQRVQGDDRRAVS